MVLVQSQALGECSKRQWGAYVVLMSITGGVCSAKCGRQDRQTGYSGAGEDRVGEARESDNEREIVSHGRVENRAAMGWRWEAVC